MKTITIPTIYLSIAAVVNIALIVTWTILYHRHMQKEIAKQKRRLERKRGKYFDITVK